MTCDHATDRLDAFLDGESDAAEASALRLHLADCDACAAELALAERLQATLRTMPRPTVPADLLAASLAAARTAELPVRAPRRAADRRSAPGPSTRRRIAWGAGVIAPLVLVVALLSRPDASREVVPPPVAEQPRTLPAPPPDRGAMPSAEGVAAAPPPAAPSPARPAAPAVAATRPATRSAPPRRRVRSAPAPRQDPAPAVAPPPTPELPPEPEFVAELPEPELPEPEPTPEQIAQARSELALAFGLIAEAQSKAGRAVRDEAGALTDALDLSIPF